MTWNNGSKTNDRKHMKMHGRYIEQNCGTTNQDQGQNQQDLMISWLNVTVTFNHKWWLTESIFKRNEICSHVLDVCNIPQLIHIAVHASYFLCIIMIQQYMLIYAYSWHLLGIQTVSGCISSNMGALLRRNTYCQYWVWGNSTASFYDCNIIHGCDGFHIEWSFYITIWILDKLKRNPLNYKEETYIDWSWQR